MAKEYAVARPASMPDMSGKERWTIIGGPFAHLTSAEYAAKRRPPLKGQPVTIIERDVTDWVTHGNDTKEKSDD